MLRLALILGLNLLRLLSGVEVLHTCVLDELLRKVMVLSAVRIHHAVYIFNLDVLLLVFADDRSMLSLRLQRSLFGLV